MGPEKAGKFINLIFKFLNVQFSSLIQALIGEMHRTSGWSSINGQISYVPQQAWIQNLSVRDNILFGKPMDESFYESVVNSCCLTQDMIALSAGDATEIGEKGKEIRRMIVFISISRKFSYGTRYKKGKQSLCI